MLLSRLFVLLCQLYASAISIAMFVAAARHQFSGIPPTGWVLACSWWGASLAMLAYREPRLTRIGLYLASLQLGYYAVGGLAAGLAAPVHCNSRAITDAMMVDTVSAVACLPLVLGLAVRIALQNGRRAAPAPPPLAPDAGVGSTSDA